MSKRIPNTLDTGEAIRSAREAIDALECGRNYAQWMAALMSAIGADIEHRKACHVRNLASLGVYLAEELDNDLDVAREQLQRRIDAQEGAL